MCSVFISVTLQERYGYTDVTCFFLLPPYFSDVTCFFLLPPYFSDVTCFFLLPPYFSDVTCSVFATALSLICLLLTF